MKFPKKDSHPVSNSNHKHFSNNNSQQYRKEKHKINANNGFNKSHVSSPKSAKVTEVFDNKLKIFIKNIPNDGDAVKLQIQQLLSPCGDIIHERYFPRRRGTHVVYTALIVFKSEAAVKKALEIHGSLVEGHHIIVSTYAQYNANPIGVHVRNLSWDVTEEDLWNVFESIGKILFINIANPVNLSASDQPLEGEVIFETEEQAKEALYFENTEVHGLPLVITRISLENKSNHADFAVHVSGLPQDVTKEKVIQFFEKCGVVRIVKLNFKLLSAVIHFTVDDSPILALQTYADKRILTRDAYVDVKKEWSADALRFKEVPSWQRSKRKSDDAVKAAIRLDGRSLGDSRISVHQRKGEVFNWDVENPVYICNIPESVRDVDIFLAFQDCGNILDVRFLQRRTSSKKRAVIQFKYPDSVVKALELDGLEMGGEPVSVSNSRGYVTSKTTDAQQSEANGNGTFSSKLKSQKKKRKHSAKRVECIGKKLKKKKEEAY